MSLIKSMRRQYAVWWKVIRFDMAGQPVYGLPIEVKCRWTDHRLQFTNAAGEIAISNSQVFVDREMSTQDVLWKGRLANVTSQVDPFLNEGARKIEAFNNTPNLKASEFLLEAVL